MSDEKPPADRAPDGPPPVPGVEIFDDLASAPTVSDPMTEQPAPRAPGPREPAHPVLRAFAFFLDGLGTFVLTVLVVFTGLNADAGFAFSAILLVPAASALLSTVLTAVFGVTPAKAILGLRVVDAETGARPGMRSILRSLVIVAPLLVTLGLAWGVPAIWRDDAGAFLLFLLPPALWVGMLAVVVARRTDRYRGLQDLAARSVVVRVR